MHHGRLLDRAISVGGLSMTVIPEFVWAVVLILVFALWLHVLPVTAAAPAGSGPLTQTKYLLLPALCLVFVLFGYIARMARVGTVEALRRIHPHGDPEGLLGGPWSGVTSAQRALRRSRVATQTGYLIGGLVAIELIFNYQDRAVAVPRTAEGLPVARQRRPGDRPIYLVATLIADICYAALNPRIRLSGER